MTTYTQHKICNNFFKKLKRCSGEKISKALCKYLSHTILVLGLRLIILLIHGLLESHYSNKKNIDIFVLKRGEEEGERGGL